MAKRGVNTLASLLEEQVLESSLDCVHCGLCLNVCPTYRLTGRENSSPRGRIYMIRGIAEGRVAAGSTVAEELHFCLGCRACESACPSGVDYGAMLEHARAALVESGARRGLGPRLERWLLARVIARDRVRALFFAGLRIIQRLRFDVAFGGLLPGTLSRAAAAAPRVPARHERRPLPACTPAQGERRGSVILLEGCIMRETFGHVNRATALVLARNGYDVLAPEGQGCCGALQAHAGDLETARSLARRNLAAWKDTGAEAVISNSAGCGASLHGLAHWLAADELDGLPPVKDVCEFLDEVGLRVPMRSLQGCICYDDPCHLVHGQSVSSAPRRLLDSIPGFERVELPDPTACCGAAGIYNITHAETSAQVLAPKLDAIEACGPDIVVTGNPGCMMQIDSGLRERGLEIEVAHPIELIERATRPNGSGA